MKYKKYFNIHRGTLVLCLAAGLNEFARYKRINSLDAEKSKIYLEASENYNILMARFISANPYRNVLKYFFGIDMDRLNNKKSHTSRHCYTNEDYIIENII